MLVNHTQVNNIQDVWGQLLFFFSPAFTPYTLPLCMTSCHQSVYCCPCLCTLLSPGTTVWVVGPCNSAYMHAALLGPYFPLFKVIFKSSWITYEMNVSLYTLNASGEYGQYWVALFWKVTPYVTRLQPLQSNLLRDSFTEKSKTIPLWFSFSWGIHSSGDHYPNAKSNK